MMKMPILAWWIISGVCALCLANADTRSKPPSPPPAAQSAADLAGAMMPMPDVFGAILTTR